MPQRAVLDDGFGSLMIVLNADLTSKLLGKTVEECEQETKEQGLENLKSILDELNDILLMRPLHAKGTVTTDDYGAMMICSDIDLKLAGEEVPSKARELLNNLDVNDYSPEVV